VSVWKRNSAGITQPQDVNDDFDHFVIQCEKGKDIGQFIFPKSVLGKKGIIFTSEKKENEVLGSTLLGTRLKTAKRLKLKNGNWNTFSISSVIVHLKRKKLQNRSRIQPI
tara:strand:+ start:33762 stop:34091 length:330 start_codon:yes stop_codon:yes gene_type:complete